MWIVILFTVVATYVIYYCCFKPYNYWKNRGITYEVPLPLVGNFGDTIFRRIHDSEVYDRLYKKYAKERYVGIYVFMKPALLVRDLDLIKKICIEEFDNFTDRVRIFDRTFDPIIGNHLTNLKGEKWKEVRATLHSTLDSFSTKNIYSAIDDCAEKFSRHFVRDDTELLEIELSDAFSRYDCDVTYRISFGTITDSLKDNDSDFYKAYTELKGFGASERIKLSFVQLFPFLAKLFQIRVHGSDKTDFFKKMVVQALQNRDADAHSLVKYIIDNHKRIKEERNGESGDETEIGNSIKNKVEWTEDEITAHALIYFICHIGSDAVQSACTFMAYELALNPSIQVKLQEEIDNVQNSGNQPMYEAIIQMKYFNCVVAESLRKWPPVYQTDRQCVKNFFEVELSVPDDEKIVIEKGTAVIIPIMAIHRDPTYFPEPDKFSPERFSEENMSSMIPGSYMPFGKGPRQCIEPTIIMLLLLFGAAAIIGIFYYYSVKLNYWKNRGVEQVNPKWIFGDFMENALGKMNGTDIMHKLYEHNRKARYIGIYRNSTPILLVRDPELIKQITVKDFDSFTDHVEFIPPDADPFWSKNIFSLTGSKWREMRGHLSPLFTSSKMRAMFTMMTDCAENLVEHLQKNEGTVTVDMRDILSRYTNDVIASAVFGVKVDSLDQPNNEFYRRGKEVADFSSFWKVVKMLTYSFLPAIKNFTKIQFISDEAGAYFLNVVNDSIRTKQEKGIVSPDMLNLFVEARKNMNQSQELAKNVNSSDDGDVTNEDITAHALIFFIGGFESVSYFLSFTVYELALNPEVQEKLRKEIRQVMEESRGKVTYETISNMAYMEMVASESLRKWPHFTMLNRVCTKPYTIEPVTPNEKRVHLDVGTQVVMPMFSIQHDEDYYPNPERFDPERFNDENKRNMNPYTYFPFGIGPRNCIGSRFTMLEAKILLFHLLNSFEIVPVEKTAIPLVFSKRTIINLKPVGGFWLGFKRC